MATDTRNQNLACDTSGPPNTLPLKDSQSMPIIMLCRQHSGPDGIQANGISHGGECDQYARQRVVPENRGANARRVRRAVNEEPPGEAAEGTGAHADGLDLGPTGHHFVVP